MTYLLFFSLSACTTRTNEALREYSTKNFEDLPYHYREWAPYETAENLVLAIHGYNDYSNSFEIPARFLSKLLFRFFLSVDLPCLAQLPVFEDLSTFYGFTFVGSIFFASIIFFLSKSDELDLITLQS